MTVDNNNPPFSTASFFTSFSSNNNKKKAFNSLGLPTSPINHSFLQSPLWNTITTTKNTTPAPKKKKLSKQQQQAIQQAIYILPKSPSNVSIYLQLPKFRSLSVLMRCGHVSQLVGNWLCNPMEQLKRNAEMQQQQQQQQQEEDDDDEQQQSTSERRRRSSSLCIMPPLPSSSTLEEDSAGTLSVLNNETSIVPFYKPTSSSLFVHFQQQDNESSSMEIKYVPSCLYTVVCVTYNCGSVSLSFNQIESLDFLVQAALLDPFLVKCDLLPNHPVTIHQLPAVDEMMHLLPPQQQHRKICDYPAFEKEETIVPSIVECPLEETSNNIVTPQEETSNILNTLDPILYIDNAIVDNDQVIIHRPDELHPYLLEKEVAEPKKQQDLSTEVVEFIHIKETILYQQEEDYEDDLESSSEEYSVLDYDDTEEEEEEPTTKDTAQIALLRLVQDTLEYIQSSGGAYSDELNSLEYKLYNYCRANTSSSVYN